MNGGPGLPHNFAKPLRNLACDGREVILYDQAATGQSALPPDTSATDDYPEILELSFYAETELPKLIQHFGFPNYHVLGSSWGTEVAFQFAVTAAAKLQEQKLQSLILNAPISDNRRFVRYQWDPVTGSVGTLPTFIQERLLHFNRTKDFASPEFQALEEIVTKAFVARLGIPVDCWGETVAAGINGETGQICGPTDFFLPSGHTTNWTVLPYLHRVQDLPMQLNYGGHDLVRPQLIADTVQDLRKPECNMLPTAGHSLELDAPEHLYPLMRDFLVRLETAIANNVPFHPTAAHACPRGASVGKKTKMTDQSNSTFGWVLAMLVAVVVSFTLGAWFGKRRQKRSEYEAVVELD